MRIVAISLIFIGLSLLLGEKYWMNQALDSAAEALSGDVENLRNHIRIARYMGLAGWTTLISGAGILFWVKLRKKGNSKDQSINDS